MADPKICSKCRDPQPVESFGKCGKSKDGLKSWCKSCNRQAGREYYGKNRRRCLDNALEWQRNNPKKSNANTQRHRDANREKVRARDREKYRENRDKMLKRSRKYYWENREKVLEAEKHRRLSKYGLTLESYNRLLSQQGGLCPICERSLLTGTKVDIDHCHETGKVRGLLHNKCNLLLGLANDDLNVLYNAIKYLAESRLPKITLVKDSTRGA